MQTTETDSKFQKVVHAIKSNYTVYSKNILDMELKKAVYALGSKRGTFALMISETEQGILCSFLSHQKHHEWKVDNPKNITNKITELGR